MDYKLNVRVLSGRRELRQAMCATQGKILNDNCKPLSDEGMAKAILSQHGSLNKYIFHVTAVVEDRIHTHIRTHSLLNSFYQCSTSRPDITSDTGELRVIDMFIPLGKLEDIAGWRLCRRSWGATTDFIGAILDEIAKIEPYTRVVMQPNCVQRGICREGVKCCKYTTTKDFEEKRRRLCQASIDMVNGKKLT